MFDADELKARSRALAAWNRKRVIDRARGCCEVCSEDVRFVAHVHHIRPVELLGGGETENLIVLCPTCHEVLSKLLHARKTGNSTRWRAIAAWLVSHPRYTEQQAALISQIANCRSPFVEPKL